MRLSGILKKTPRLRCARYEEIVKIAPQLADAHINLGNINEGLRNFGMAHDNYLEAIKVDPGSVKGRTTFVRLLRAQRLCLPPDHITTTSSRSL